MSATDGLTGMSAAIDSGTGGHQGASQYPGSALTLAATLVLTLGYANMLRIDPGGAGRTITLPAEEGAKGAWFEILNTANAAENLTVDNDNGDTIVTISQDEKAKVVCDGSSWVHMGIVSIALT